MPDGIRWRHGRERDVALACGLRVVKVGEARASCEILLPDAEGEIKVARVVPGDGRHLALWELLMTPEREWGAASWPRAL